MRRWISSRGHTRTLCELSGCQIAFGNSSSHRCFLRDFLSVSCGGGGEEKAVTEASDIVLYITAFIGAAFIPCFLWHLWLAPYRILNEKLEEISAGNVGGGVAPKLPSKVDVSLWDGTAIFQLGDAACLWVEVEPHKPLSNMSARAMFAKLSGAIFAGQLHWPKPPLRGLAELLNGQTPNLHYSIGYPR